MVFYGNSLFSADVTAAMGGKHTVKTESMSNLYIQLMAMPGYILGILLIVRQQHHTTTAAAATA